MNHAELRFNLSILSYPEDATIGRVCELIYKVQDRNLMATLSTLPYHVGRSFSEAEIQALTTELRSLKVGHRYRCVDPRIPPVEYDPEASGNNLSSDSGISPSLNPLKRRRSLQITITLMASVIGVLLASQFYSPHKDSSDDLEKSTSSSQAFARLERLERSAEYRRNREILWADAEESMPLSPADALRTREQSTALIRYRDGSSLFVKPQSIVVLGQETEMNHRSVSLQDGGLSARLKPSTQQRKLSIKTQMGTLEIQNVQPGEPEPQVETNIQGDQLQVKLLHGSASLIPIDKELKPVQLRQQQQLTATSKKISMPETFTPEILTISPPQMGMIMRDPSSSDPVRFEWEALDDEAVYQWELASDREMKSILLSQESSEPRIQINYIDLGRLYWRVSTNVQGIRYESKVQVLDVQKP
jgi:hypothetical protein